MAKPLKIVLIVLGVVLLLVVGAVAAAVALFDPNDYRGKITATVKDQTGRELTLGNIQLSVFPWLNVKLDDVSFSNAPGFGTQPMAQAQHAAVGVQLFPLLFDKEVRVSTVTLEGLKLDLAKDATGKSNWDDLVKTKDEKPKDDEKGTDLKSIDIAGVTLKDADIRYRDAQSKQAYHLTKVNLETGALRPGSPFDVEASLSALAEAQKISADITTSSTILLDLVANKAKVDNLKLDVKAKGPGQELATNLFANVAANLETQVVNVSDLKADFKAAMQDKKAEGTLTGKIAADLRQQLANIDGLKLDFKAGMKDLDAQGTLTVPQVKAALATQVFELAGVKLDANAAGAAVPGGKQSAKISGDLSYDGTKGSMRFGNGKLAAAGLDVATSISGEGLKGDSPRLSGPITVAQFNPRTLLATLGQADIKTTDDKVLQRASFSGNYSGSFKSARVENLKLALDDTNASGSLGINDFATQALVFGLVVDKIDADRYLAPEDKTAKPPAKSTEELNKTQLPVEAINKLNATGTLDIREMKLKGATLKDVRLKLDGPKGSPKMVKLDAQTFGGNMSMASTLKPGAAPTYAINTTVSTVSLTPLMQTFVGKDLVSGLGNIKLDLTSGGATVGDVRRGLNGSVALDFQNGAVKGFNLGQMLRQANAVLRGQQYTANEPAQTDFTSIGFAAQIVNGVLKSDSLNALSPLFRVNGSGEIDLATESLNYLVSPTIVNSATGQGGKGLEDLAGLTIPIRLTGSLRQPKYKLDLQTALKQKAADQLRGKLADKVLGGQATEGMTQEEFKQKRNEKIGQELNKGLEKLFGGKKKPATTAPADGTTTTPPATETPPPAAPAEEKKAETPPPT